MAYSYVGFSQKNTANTTTHSPAAWPASIATDDIVICLNVAANNVTYTGMTGWNEFTNSPVGNTGTFDVKGGAWWKKYTDGDSLPTLTSSGNSDGATLLIAYRGIDTTLMIEDTDSQGNGVASGTIDTPDVTSSGSNRVIFTAGMFDGSSSEAEPEWTEPSGYTKDEEIESANNDLFVAWATKVENSGTFSPTWEIGVVEGTVAFNAVMVEAGGGGGVTVKPLSALGVG